MKVRTRLVLFGVLVPAVMLSLAALGAERRFSRQLQIDIDRELVASAAVESVGAFDGIDGQPHLHLGRSYFKGRFADSDPRAALYDASARLVVSDPLELPAIPFGPFLFAEIAMRPRFWTSQETLPSGARVERRELAVTASNHANHTVFVLRLSRSMASKSAALTEFWRSIVAFFASATAISLAIWLLLARWFSRRLNQVASRLPHHETAAGDLPTWEPTAASNDEIDALDRALAGAFSRVRDAARAQEQFVAYAAHELKTPMALMRAEMDTVLRQPPDVATYRGALQRSRQEVDRLAAVSRGLLDLVGAQRVDIARHRVDIRRMVFEALDHFESAIVAKALTVAFDAPEIEVMADDSALRSAFDNLLDNAIRHSPPGARLAIKAERHGNWCEIAVQDGGAGIAADAQARVFEPFFRAASASGGSGLGLAIAKQSMRRLGGDVELVDPGVGVGATFILRVPLNAVT